MAIEDKVFSGDTLRVGYRFQRHWDNSMAYAFFCAEVGAGLFFVSLLLDSVAGMIIGLIPVATGKPYFHLAHMGVPARSWRAALRPDRSWISRGLLGLSALIGCGALLVVCLLFGSTFGVAPDSALVTVLKLLAGVFALVTMTYQGFAMSHSSAIAIWNSAIMPLASFLYSLAVGVAVLQLIPGAGGATDLTNAQLLLLLSLGVMHLMLLHAGWHGSPGARTSVELLLQTLYAKWFWGLTVAAGILLPALLLWWAPDLFAAKLVACLGILAGFMAWRILIFKIGVYEPIMSMNPFNPMH
jgi:formate-dependent nitrite reductase membrane component NrfD